MYINEYTPSCRTGRYGSESRRRTTWAQSRAVEVGLREHWLHVRVWGIALHLSWVSCTFRQGLHSMYPLRYQV